MKVKLEHLEVFMTLDKNRCQVVNARKQIANIIYSQGAGLGLAGQALAVKMWNGKALVITHYQRLLDYLKPDVVHVLLGGRIVKSGGPELAVEIENKGFDWIKAETSAV